MSSALVLRAGAWWNVRMLPSFRARDGHLLKCFWCILLRIISFKTAFLYNRCKNQFQENSVCFYRCPCHKLLPTKNHKTFPLSILSCGIFYYYWTQLYKYSSVFWELKNIHKAYTFLMSTHWLRSPSKMSCRIQQSRSSLCWCLSQPVSLVSFCFWGSLLPGISFWYLLHFWCQTIVLKLLGGMLVEVQQMLCFACWCHL